MLLLLVCILLPEGLDVQPAGAAEIRQIRTSTLVQIGDSNRSYSVRLACIEPLPGRDQEAMAWLRSQAPRGARVNLRPMGQQHGELLAQVSVIGRGRNTSSFGPSLDLATGLVQQGLALPAAPAANLPDCPALPSDAAAALP